MNIGRETETIEFKKSTAEKDSGIISIASILNKHDRGILYFGVLDSGDVCGMDVGRDTVRTLSRDIASSIRPSCWYKINERKTSDGLSFIEVQFSGDNSPYSAFGRYYERFADEDRMISDVELEKWSNEAFKQIGELRYDSEMKEDGITEILKFGIAFSGKKVCVRTE